jgi:hypothetical protein
MRIEEKGHLTVSGDPTGNRNWNLPSCVAQSRLVEKQIIAMRVLKFFYSCKFYNRHDVIKHDLGVVKPGIRNQRVSSMSTPTRNY